jgi:membrane protein DedA with SNARE-associated domain
MNSSISLASAGIVMEIIDNITSWIATYGYPAVFVAALLETIFPVIPSELIFPLVGYTAYSKGLGIGHAIGMAMAGSLGTTVGGIIIYFIALKAGKSAIIKFGKHLKISESSIQKSEAWFERHGKLAVFLGRMAPGVREIISIPAGVGRMNLLNFIVFTFLGSLFWSIGLTLVGYYAGQAWEEYFQQQLSSAFSIASILVVIGFLIVLGVKYFRRKRINK